MEFEANETFYWYHADDLTPVSTAEMNDIRDMLWANVTEDLPAPEYSFVAWLARNWTIDLKDEEGNKKEYYNRRKIYLKSGKYKLRITLGGKIINKEIEIKKNEKVYVSCE